jgi:hypothetical protein
MLFFLWVMTSRLVNWCSEIPLVDLITSRDIYRAGLARFTSFKDSTANGNWAWPNN